MVLLALLALVTAATSAAAEADAVAAATINADAPDPAGDDGYLSRVSRRRRGLDATDDEWRDTSGEGGASSKGPG